MLKLSDLNVCSKDDFAAALANVFEYSPWIAEQAAVLRPFAGVNELFAAMKSVVDRAPEKVLIALIRAHPDLANKTYRAKFGFPYVVCVRRHTRDSVLRDFERRLPNDAKAEAQASIGEICRIAALRLDQLVASEDKLPVHGRLSTHVLDTHGGKPAAGIAVELTELSDLGESRVVARAVTNSDGRTDQPLISGRPVPIGRYELAFHVGAYFADRGVPLSDPPFLDRIPLQFAVSDPEGHLHVPLLVTPWSYATYRGS
jgi:2-oxo-4-hydroxy-4-carboxy-5-ureidoimidazoline decarboxylase